MQQVAIQSKVGENATHIAVPVLKIGGYSNGFVAVLYGSDNITVAATPFALPGSPLFQHPDGNDKEIIISSVMLWNATIARLPSIMLGESAVSSAVARQEEEAASESSPTVEVEVVASATGGYKLLLPPPSSLQKLCYGAEEAFTSMQSTFALESHSILSLRRRLQEKSRTTAVRTSVACSLQLVWTLQITLEYDQLHNDSTGDSYPFSPSDTPPLAPVYHTQSCPPDCLGTGSGGLVTFVQECPGYFIGPQCNDPGAAAEAGCAFGAPPFCRRCPKNAACPGGFRAWPAAGFWSPDEMAGVALRCAAPAAARCTGWSIPQRRSTCGTGYDPDAPMCGSCLSEYFLQDGACLPCASAPLQAFGGGSFLFPLAMVLGTVLAFYLLIAIIFSRAFRVTALPVSKGLGYRLAAEVTMWLVSTLQVLLQLARAPSPGLPPWLRNGFSFLQALEIDTSGLAPAGCTTSISPFLMAQLITATCVIGMGGFVALGCLHLRKQQGRQLPSSTRELQDASDPSAPKPRAVWGFLQFVLSVLAILLYGPALAKSLDVVSCIDMQHTTWEISPDSGELQSGTERVLAWAADTRVLCYQGEHLAAAILAWLSLLIVGVGLPLFLWCFGSIHLYRYLRAGVSGGPEKPIRSAPGSVCQAREQHKTHRRGRFNHCLGRCVLCQTLSESVHAPLRQQRPWATIYGYGQPWLRPSSITLTLVTSLLSSLLPADSQPILRGLALGPMLLAAAAVCIWPSITLDHKWAAWKRWPRAFTSLASTALVALQCALALSDHAVTPTVTALSWLVAFAAVLLPVSLIASLLVWITRMVSCLAFWRCPACCCGTTSTCLGCRSVDVANNSVDRLSSFLAFGLSVDSKRAVTKIVHRAGGNSVVVAMGSATPSTAMRNVQAASSCAVQKLSPSAPGLKDEDPVGGCDRPFLLSPDEPLLDFPDLAGNDAFGRTGQGPRMGSAVTMNPLYRGGRSSHHQVQSVSPGRRRSTVIHANPLIGMLRYSESVADVSLVFRQKHPNQGGNKDTEGALPDVQEVDSPTYQEDTEQASREHEKGGTLAAGMEERSSSVRVVHWHPGRRRRRSNSRRSSKIIYQELVKREVSRGITQSLRTYASTLAKTSSITSIRNSD